MIEQAKVQPTIRHESSTNTEMDYVFSFHNGPHLIISGEVIDRSDNHGLLACPAHNQYYSIEYNPKTNEITTESSKSLLDICSYPSGVDRKVFLNVSLNQQNASVFDENTLESISLFDERLAGHLSYINTEDYQGSEHDATFYFNGKILDINTSHPVSYGADCNYERATVLIELNLNDEFESTLALLDIEYMVPSKYINNIDEFDSPCSEVTYYSFKTWGEYMEFQAKNK